MAAVAETSKIRGGGRYLVLHPRRMPRAMVAIRYDPQSYKQS
jgi:hypothetical protein